MDSGPQDGSMAYLRVFRDVVRRTTLRVRTKQRTDGDRLGDVQHGFVIKSDGDMSRIGNQP